MYENLWTLWSFWLNIEIDSEEPAPVPFFGQVPSDEMEATAPRIFTRQMKAGPLGFRWDVTWIYLDFT